MRITVILLVALIGTFIAFSLGVRQAVPPTPYANVATPLPTQWATSTDPHEDPQVSPVPSRRSPPTP